MAIKHNIRRWDLKKYAKKKVFFKADFVVYWAQKEVVEPTNLVQNPLDIVYWITIAQLNSVFI